MTAWGQLIRVNDPFDHTSGEDGTTWVYEYDRGGNILSKKRYAYTMDTIDASTPLQQNYAYSYEDSNWKDKLTAYNGIALTYDAIGNLTSDSTWSYEWEKGRQLKQMSSSDVTAIFEYNHDGLRVRKTVNGVVTDYTLHGKNVVHMTQGANSLHFWYDASGKPALVEWNNGTTSEKYAYLHNLQGDIVGIIDSTGVEVVKYTYDAWGKILSTTGTLANTLGMINPFRYRGYVYDEETGLYYLRSRYYNSAWCRFINADIHLGIWGELLSHSLYSYCQNSPIVYLDFDGNVRLYGVEIAYYGFFHRIVQDSIIELNPGIEKEQHPSPNSKSRIDLKLGNEIYEIKPNNSVSSLLGMKQLGGYLAEGEGELILGTTSLVLPEYSPMIVGDWCITLDVEQKGALISYSVNAEKRGKINSQEAPVISKDQKPVLNNARKVVQMFLGGVAVGFGLGYAQRYGGAGKGVTCACFGF